jgi:Uma2 family endonuclease
MKTLALWSINDYHNMIAAGILQDRRVELLAGEIVEMTPETPIHYTTAKRGSRYLEDLLAGRAEVRFNGPISLSNSEPEPDVAIAQLTETGYADRHPNATDIFWVIEVARSSLQKDLDAKARIYATEGIQEYWVVDLAARQLIVFRYPENGLYTTEFVVDSETLNPLAFPDLVVVVDRLLP